jgi:hypothetical protein
MPIHAGEVRPIAPALSAADLVRNVREERNPRESVNKVVHEQQGHTGGEFEDEQSEGQPRQDLPQSEQDDSPDAIVDVSTDYLASEEARAHPGETGEVDDTEIDGADGSTADEGSGAGTERHVNIEV